MATQLTLPVRLPEETTLNNFFVGKNQALSAYLQKLLTCSEFYTYLWGSSGVGCTHLLHACCHQAYEEGLSALYLPLKELHAISPRIFENLDTFALLCLDDIEIIVGNSVVEEALFHLYNRLHTNKGRLLIAGKSPPSQLGIHLPDLASRLCNGPVFQVQPLEDDNKLAALQLRASLRSLNLPDETGHFLLNHFPRDFSNLCSLLEKLDQASLAAQRRLTIPFVKNILLSKN